MIVLQIRFVAV